jgi:hypothetical protein
LNKIEVGELREGAFRMVEIKFGLDRDPRRPALAASQGDQTIGLGLCEHDVLTGAHLEPRW